MPARLPLLLLAATALAATTAAQSSRLAPSLAGVQLAPSLHVYAGRYDAGTGSIEVRADADGLTLVAHGAALAARLAPLATPRPTLDARAGGLLAGWVAGDLAPLLAAVRPDRRAEAATDLAAARDAFVRGHGPAVSARVMGSFSQADGRAVTLAQIQFDRGTEWVSLVWAEGGHLLTLTRGLGPVVVGAVRPVAPDVFADAGPALWFSRAPDGRIDGLHLGSSPLALR